jgi:PIN domain nuclease of toxin-antitoxin system
VNLLLDTHCLIWALTDAPQLGSAARRAISEAQSVWFSEASIWELGLKWRKGKINLQPRRIHEQALDDGFRSMPITVEQLLLSCELRQDHGDPFERLLYAQARCEGHHLMTIDRALQDFGTRIVKPR